MRDWLARAQEIVDGGRGAHLANPLRQEAGDSLLMKIGEAADRLACSGVPSPRGIEWSDAIGNKNWLIHQYDAIDREITWATLTTSLPGWTEALRPIIAEAVRTRERSEDSRASVSDVMKRKPFTAS